MNYEYLFKSFIMAVTAAIVIAAVIFCLYWLIVCHLKLFLWTVSIISFGALWYIIYQDLP